MKASFERIGGAVYDAILSIPARWATIKKAMVETQRLLADFAISA